MSKWKCGICNSEFENYHAQGFDSIIYCPLCYYKELYKREKKEIEQLRTELNTKNNIINELEKWLKDNLSICRTNQEYSSNKFYTLKESIYYTVLKKLQELKDSD